MAEVWAHDVIANRASAKLDNKWREVILFDVKLEVCHPKILELWHICFVDLDN